MTPRLYTNSKDKITTRSHRKRLAKTLKILDTLLSSTNRTFKISYEILTIPKSNSNEPNF